MLAVYKCPTYMYVLSINSLCMLQQISRARNCKEVDVLFIEYKYRKKKNRYITFEENKEIEQDEFDKYQEWV